MRVISIVTAFYKGNKYLSQLVDSVDSACEKSLQQDASYCFEWIVVNDSPDVSVDSSILKKCDSVQVRVIQQPKNGGIHQARITGIRQASGEAILMLDQDDVISDDFFCKMIPMLFDHHLADVAVCNAYSENKDGSTSRLYLSKGDLYKITDLDYYLSVTNPIQSPGQCLIRKSSIPEEWFQNVLSNNGSDDLLLWIMMLARECKFITCEECLYTHKYSGENVSESMKVLGDSSYQVADILEKGQFLSSKQLHILRDSIAFSMKSKQNKIKTAYQYHHLVKVRLKYLLKEKFSAKI